MLGSWYTYVVPHHYLFPPGSWVVPPHSGHLRSALPEITLSLILLSRHVPVFSVFFVCLLRGRSFF